MIMPGYIEKFLGSTHIYQLLILLLPASDVQFNDLNFLTALQLFVFSAWLISTNL
jgi:hypothetical protein